MWYLSFSSSVKNELCRIDKLNGCCLIAELAAVIGISGSIKNAGTGEASIRILTENAAFARRVFTFIKKVFNINPETVIRKSRKFKKHVSYILVITASMGANDMLKSIGITQEVEGQDSFDKASDAHKNMLSKNCCRKAYLRGAFLAGGSISDPEKTYHLEITSHSREMADKVTNTAESFDLNTKVIMRKGNHVIYLKEGENIVDFLNIIGAHNALLELENVRILKDMRNSVNRIVNCETANLEKTVNASVRQIENIKYIKDNVGFGLLPENLKEIAELRLIYSDLNLKELGEMLSPQLGKSGVNHRLRRLEKIAEDVRTLKGEL